MAYPSLNADERGGVGPSGKPSLTVSEAAVQLTRTGLSWSPRLGEAATVTYAYRATAPAEMPEETSGFQRLTFQQIRAVEDALALWSQVADIRFVRVGAGTGGEAAYSDDAAILFGNYSSGADGATAFASYPGGREASSRAGDVWINYSHLANAYVTNQNDFGFATLVHEIGHAIGLDHPSDYDALDAEAPTYARSADYHEDSEQYTLMSYFPASDTGAAIPRGKVAPGGPMIDDIAAAQRLYGPNMAAKTGDTVYGYIYGEAGERPENYLRTSGSDGVWGSIWDAGGVDTLDFQTSPAPQTIDLRAGAFSDVHGVAGSLSIALGVTIENAIGGESADILIGNEVANLLRGNGGGDRLIGGAGDDRIEGGAGADSAVLSGVFRRSVITVANGTVSITGRDGADTATGVERFQFADGMYVIDPDGAGAQVQRLYGAVLGRAPDVQGLEYWLDQLNDAGRSLASVAGDFLLSGEFQAAGANVAASGDYVDFLYRRTLGREADVGGRAYWAERLDAGLSRADALLSFSESGEHQARTAAVTGQGHFETDDAYQTVALLYDSFLDRRPDADGLIYWAEQVKAGSVTVASVADLFAGSAEFQGRTAGLSAAGLVDYLYATTLDRTPGEAERGYWVGELDRGLPKSAMLLRFAVSDEHQFLYAAHITGGVDVA